jgi:hypothetical protein
MLTNVPLRDFKDFKQDVVICPHCTQHLMGVKDVRWGAKKVEFTYGCSGCGTELDKTIAEDVPTYAQVPAQPSIKDAPPVEPEPVRMAAEAAIPAPAAWEREEPVVEDLGAFPFKKTGPTERKPHVLKQTFIEDRIALKPKQVFAEEHAVFVPRDLPAQTTRASVLLRDVAIFNL